MVCFQKDTAIRDFTDRSRWPELLSIWEAAVRDSHDFLSEEDIAFFRDKIPSEYLPYLGIFGITDGQDNLCGFMALSDEMIEMLFIHPSTQGKGYGTRLLRFATEVRGIRRVDVNEQNPKALAFYQSKGFKIMGRDATDSSGKPFPILHLSL
ncbi:MAG: GNAT family N-acetyltransferase [Odoribacter sp.]|nr:GNAT family N-acetyltransferase [Odoribacter sp.]